MSDLDKLTETIGNEPRIISSLADAINYLDLSTEQILAFCEATPNGQELWEMFESQRDNPELSDVYDFISFVAKVLASTDFPVTK